MQTLFLIPARKGSKGIPGKNTKLLQGKPLAFYSIEIARALADDDMICVSTDDAKLIKMCATAGLNVPFMRPANLATDTASSNEVIAHALAYYDSKKVKIDTLVLLQPTSPFRTIKHVQEALKLVGSDTEMIVGVKETKANPYFTLMEENKNAFLEKSKKLATAITRRQDAPSVYEINGAIYIIDVKSYRRKKNISKFTRVKKYVMNVKDSLDIDTPLDWQIAEFLLSAQANKK